ncbi:MAG: porin [Paraburkholderia sp.]|uniref:porin n=1 Tax=Paraburkholderia sp. TaxID=1926495 RepID=UPI003C59CB5C
MQSGNERPGWFGITGTEELGGGYAAVFRLESGFNVGTSSYTIPGAAMDRYACVGVSGMNLGTFTLAPSTEHIARPVAAFLSDLSRAIFIGIDELHSGTEIRSE